MGVDSAVAPLPSCPVHCLSFIITPTGCRRPPVLTSMLMLSWNVPLVCDCAAAYHASSFDLLCYSFSKCAFSFCCCDTLSFGFCKSVFSFCCCGFFFRLDLSRYFLCISFSFLAAAFFIVSTISWYLSSSSVISMLVFFLHMFLGFPPNMSVLPGRVDQESIHDTSMVTAHVDHVVGLSVLHIPLNL